MGKRNNLNGLPNNLVQRYFSTMMYFDKGYMPCWIWKQAINLGISELEIDILNKTTIPKEMKSNQIIVHLDALKEMISKTLTRNHFDEHFIINAKFKIKIFKQDIAYNKVSCQAVIEDIEGRIYKGKVYKEKAFPIADSMFDKINKAN